MRGANQNRAAMGLHIIQAAGNGQALGQRAKVVVVDRNRLPAPDLAGIFERSHQLLLLGVHTDNGQLLAGELLALELQVTELPIPFRALPAGETLAIGAQGVVEFLEQTPNGVRTNREAQASQLAADLLQPKARPKALPCHRVARRLLAEQLAQLAQDFGRFFSTVGRPPPGCRIRPRSTWPPSNSRSPRATVSTSKPKRCAVCR